MDKENKSTSYKVVQRRSNIKVGKFVSASIFLVALCFAAGLAGGYVSSHFNTITKIDRSIAADGNTVISGDEDDISSVASKVGPSVVTIMTTQTTQTVFGSQMAQGVGSGIIISKDGYILTNKHVVSGSQKATVVTSDGEVYDNVPVIGTDPLNDLAFLKLSGVANLRPAALGDSSSVRIGQKVVAIGNPLGQYQNSVTSGIISGTGRPVTAQGEDNTVESLTDLLQTDAAINAGNSGGPLVNLSGQVIGINTAVAQEAQGIGLSIPINSAKGIVKNLFKTGQVTRAYMGVRYLDITPEVAKKYNLPVKKGGWVNSDNGDSVVTGSPADKAGIKNGDIITRVGDIAVGPRGNVSSLTSEYTVGDKVPIEILRDGKTISVVVTLEKYQPTS